MKQIRYFCIVINLKYSKISNFGNTVIKVLSAYIRDVKTRQPYYA